ncbi:MAG: glycosyltransferase family 2 protein [Planctomycetota bacterium]
MTGARTPDLSIVIPFFNEEDNIAPLFAELLPVLDGIGRPFEVVAVDDGSTDATLERLRHEASLRPEIRLLRQLENRGQTAAFDAGFKAARGALVATMDGDLQIDPSDLPAMIERLETEGVDFVYGRRADRQDSFSKRVSTKIANAIRNRLTWEKIPDTGCPLKLFRAEVVKSFKLHDGMHRFFITLAHIEGFRSTEMRVRHRHRVHGSSKYGVMNRVFRALRDCLVVRWMIVRHLRYRTEEIHVRPAVVPASPPPAAEGERAAEAAS